MADLLVISFPTEAQAEEARTRVASMQREYLIELGDAVVALRKPDGSIKLNQTFQPTAAGAAGGAMWGALIGLLFLNPLAGAAMGAAAWARTVGRKGRRKRKAKERGRMVDGAPRRGRV